jgi:tetratricopeptide (TPR) repeat protein
MVRTDHEAATSYLQEALRSFREVDQDYGVAHVTTYLGMAALTRGDLGRATHMFEEGLAMARSFGDRLGTYIALYNLVQMALSCGDYQGAVSLFEEGVALSREVGDRANLAYCLEGLAVVAGVRGRRCALRASSVRPRGCTKLWGCPSTFNMNPTAPSTSTRWPQYARKWVRKPSRQRELRDGR